MPLPRILCLLPTVAMVAALAACAERTGGGDEPDGGDRSPLASPDATGAPGPPPLAVRLEPVVEGLDVPNDLAELPDGRLLISDQVGRIHVLADGELLDPPVLDLTGRVLPPSTDGGSDLELGLSGFAPHPGFADNGRIFVFYTEPPAEGAERGVRRMDVLAEFTVAGEPRVADAASERVLQRLDQQSTVHVGGHLRFGPDGLLYLGLGDSGRRGDARDPERLQGSVIRIDVDGGVPYAIPPDNPFADGGGAPEVYAYGLRNPFRLDWLDGVGLLVAEPMWSAKYQEVNVAVAGADYGWPDLPDLVPDGSCYGSPGASEPLPECRSRPDGTPIEPPVVEYGPQVGRIVSGVAAYRGESVPELRGTVIVSDWHGNLLAATPGPAGQQWQVAALAAELPGGARFTAYLWALAADSAGEVYVLTATRGFHQGRGVVYRIAAGR